MASTVQSIAFSPPRLGDAEMLAEARAFYDRMRTRRTVREFSSDPVDPELIRLAVRTAGTAPSGANQQPWSFVAIGDPETKRAIRIAAEEEERRFYEDRAGEEWLNALAPLGTDAEKPFLETAPWLIAVFAQRWSLNDEGDRVKHYYVPESVSIAIGLLIASLHSAGLATLTHTPSPMGFLNRICGRPDNEKPLVLLVVGHPAEGSRVPAISRKDESEILYWKVAE
ncbi:nitroreductase family protein [Hoeflea sp.]|uniref:nitroreductase family protein n=1 Tax=Hoeflea sp. TaxID=1940281 RepID=UPI003B5195AF